jgi:hypothetical protein
MDFKLLCLIDSLRHEDIEKRSNKIVEVLEANNYKLLKELDDVLFPEYSDWDETYHDLEEIEKLLKIA